MIIFVKGKGGAVVAYDTVAAWGMQEIRETSDLDVILINQAIGLVDVIIAVPIFILAVIGLWRTRFYGIMASFMVLEINLYWPVVAWVKQIYYAQADIQCVPFGLKIHSMLSFVFICSILASGICISIASCFIIRITTLLSD